MLGVVVKVIGGHCYPCYIKPEVTAARKKAITEKKVHTRLYWGQPSWSRQVHAMLVQKHAKHSNLCV
jgi:hypothetical protein